MSLRRNSLTVYLIALVVLVCATWVAGAAEPIVLKVATHINDPVMADPQIALMRKFEEKHPGVKIEVWYAGSNEYHDQLLAQYLGGIGPDVATVLRPQFASFVDSGLIQSLDAMIASDANFSMDSVIPSLMSSGYYQGKVYGFPVYNGPAQLFYNRDVFIERGVSEPPEYIADDNWTWDTFVDVAKKLTYDTTGDGRPEICGYDGFGTWDPGWVPFVRGAGGDIIGPDGQSALNRQETIDGLRWLQELNTVHQVTREPGHGGCSWGVGGTAMRIRWQTSGLIEKRQFDAFTLEVAMNPKGAAGYSHLAGGVPVMVSADTRHPELAYEFAKWLATESQLWTIRGGPPLTWEELQSPEYRSTLDLFDNWMLFERALMVGDVRPEPAFGIVEHDAMNRILQDVIVVPLANGTSSPRVAAEEAHRLLNNLLSQRR